MPDTCSHDMRLLSVAGCWSAPVICTRLRQQASDPAAATHPSPVATILDLSNNELSLNSSVSCVPSHGKEVFIYFRGTLSFDKNLHNKEQSCLLQMLLLVIVTVHYEAVLPLP
jgi:hypothetical protein